MNGPKTVTATWAMQYQLAISANFGSVSPDNGSWHNAGSNVVVSATAPSVVPGERYVWNGWTGTGTGSYTGTNNPANISMNGPMTEVGSWTHQFFVIPPGPPNLTSATAGYAKATLVWTAPSSDGGSPITGYKVFYGTTATSTTQFGDILSASTLTVDVTSLTPGTLYYFAIKAVNAAGDSVLSNVLSATPYRVPNAPALNSLIVASSKVTITWTAPANTGYTNLTGYKVFYGTTPTPTTPFGTWSASTLTADVTGLTPGVQYYFGVKAVNAAGDSDLSNVLSAQCGDYIYIVNGTPAVATITGYIGPGGSITIPATLGGYSVVAIGDAAFQYGSSLTSVTIPNSVTSIGANAFYSCTKLTSVTIGSGVTAIGTSAFSFCALTSVTIPNSVTSIGNDAFRYCTKLTSVSIGSGVTTIGSYAFASCTSLTSVTIPDSVTSIGSYVFSYCSKLTSVTIGSGVTVIGVGAFQSCTALITITIPNSVTSIGGWAFDSCSKLTSVTIGSGVTSIGVYAFAYCSSLTTVTIPDSVTTMDSYVFSYCSKLTSVTIGSGVTSIGDSAFSFCALTSVTIPNSVTSISAKAFAGCPYLTSVTIGSGVTSIGGYAFASCISLTTVTIPDSVTKIGMYAFFYCTKLTSVTIGSGVTTIGTSAFSDCLSLSSIAFRGMVAPTSVGSNWVYGASAAIRGHAYAASNFPAPGARFNGLIMGEYIAEVPGAPTLSSATAGSSRVTLVWTAPAGSITGYKVFYGTTSTPSTQFGSTLNASTLTVDITSLTPGTLYYFAVKAVNSAGDSVLSNVLSAKDGDYIYTVSSTPALATITGYTGAGGAITIPSTLGGYSVVAIGTSAFASCTTLT
ncbi:MAG: leucine-rich repeat protein, partial [Methanomassiliicoccales archaeon]